MVIAHENVTNALADDKGDVYYLLKKGLESYKNADYDSLEFLKGVSYTPVQRNKGIDAFLKSTYKDIPIPIRIQRPGETIEKAACSLFKAGKSKKAEIMILVAIEDTPSLFKMELPKEIHIIPSVSLSIKRTLNDLQQQHAELIENV